jgi:hypothetical protein
VNIGSHLERQRLVLEWIEPIVELMPADTGIDTA